MAPGAIQSIGTPNGCQPRGSDPETSMNRPSVR